MLMHQNRRQNVFNKGGFTFVQAGLNATALFIFSVSYFNLEGLRPPWQRYCGAHGFLAFFGTEKNIQR